MKYSQLFMTDKDVAKKKEKPWPGEAHFSLEAERLVDN